MKCFILFHVLYLFEIYTLNFELIQIWNHQIIFQIKTRTYTTLSYVLFVFYVHNLVFDSFWLENILIILLNISWVLRILTIIIVLFYIIKYLTTLLFFKVIILCFFEIKSKVINGSTWLINRLINMNSSFVIRQPYYISP